MKNKILHHLVLLCSILIVNGCTGSELTPNNATQAGAATGALAGSVIGYNSGGNRGTNAAVGALIGTAVGAGVGSAIDSQNPEPQQAGGWQ